MSSPSCDATGPFRILAHGGGPPLPEGTTTRPVQVGRVRVGGKVPVIIAGPCAVESRAQTLEVAHAVREAGGDMLRGGAFKPRTSPYDFQGLGEERPGDPRRGARGRRACRSSRRSSTFATCALVARYADVLQIGARNMQHFPLLKEAGRTGLPVLLKRHWAATLEEWLGAAEYIAVEGNLDIILCERGIRTLHAGHLQPQHARHQHRARREAADVPADHRRSEPRDGRRRDGAERGARWMRGRCRWTHRRGTRREQADPADALCDGYQSIKPSVLATLIRQVRRDAGVDDDAGPARPAVRLGS